MTLDLILIIFGATLMILGLAGSVLPFIPGIVLSYVGILLLHFTSYTDFSTDFLILWAVVIVAVELLNYYIPIWGTQKFGGGKGGSIGCTIGVFAGIFFFPPLGIILFPFLGAIVGELVNDKSFEVALKAGFGAFVGFLAGTLMQMIVAVILAYYFFKEVIEIFWK